MNSLDFKELKAIQKYSIEFKGIQTNKISTNPTRLIKIQINSKAFQHYFMNHIF